MTNSYQYQAGILRDRYGLKVAAQLSLAASALPHDVSERLRIARLRAVSKRKVCHPVTLGHLLSSGGSAILGFGDEGLNLWGRVASALPLIALVIGLFAINAMQNDRVANELAVVDAALLVDDLPPAAYADPGFAQFVRINRQGVQ